jgi:hypothetical protein
MEEPEWVFPFNFMKQGDSFFIPSVRPAIMLTKAINAARKEGYTARGFVTRENGLLGVRVWLLLFR